MFPLIKNSDESNICREVVLMFVQVRNYWEIYRLKVVCFENG